MKQCPACGANNSSDQPSCSICGASLSQVADSGAARTLFGMPALKFDQTDGDGEVAPEPVAEPAPAADAPARRGFRALGAVDIDSMNSVNMRPPPAADAPADIHSTQFGLPSPFQAEPEPAPQPTPALDDLHSTRFGSPSPFKAGQLRARPGIDARPEPARDPGPALDSTRMGMPSIDVGAEAARAEPKAAPAEPNADQYRTLVGPPLPLAEAARARDEARKQQKAEADRARKQAEQEELAAAAAAAQPQDNYRTLVGPPVPIAEAARARDAARARAETAARRVAAEPIVAAAGGRPSVIVDDGLDRKAASGEPSVIVDEPAESRRSTASASRTAARGAGAAEAPRPSNAADRDIASRVAAAFDTDEHTAMITTVQPRSYKWVIFLLVVVAGIALALWLTRDAYAFEARVEGVEATVDGERLSLSAGVVTDRPVKLRLAGDDAAPTVVDGQGTLTAELPLDDYAPGVHPLAVEAWTEQGRVELPLALTVWLRSRVGPAAAVGEPVPVELDVRPGWRPQPPAEAVSGSTFALTLDPTPALARVDAPGAPAATVSREVELRGEGETRTVTITGEVPLPRTPLLITAPTRVWRRDAESVVVTGRTAPGARVEAGGVATQADAAGAFRLTVPLGGAREQIVELRADAEGARPTAQRLTVERLTPAADATQTAAVRARQSERQGAIGETPRYDRWLSAREALRGRSVAFTGRLVAIERAPETADGSPGPDRAVVASCETGDHCPVWVTTREPILADPGQRVAVTGTLAGAETWRAAAGFVRAPRVEGALLTP